MVENPIQIVREAEAKAEDTAREAAAKAAEILDSANRKAQEIEGTAGDGARDKAAAQVAAAHEESQKALQAAMGSLDAEMEELAAKARANQTGAVRTILEALV